MAQPVIDVFSVTIFPNSSPCEVYGDIFVFEENDPESTYQLYERGVEHAEAIYEAGQELLLTGLDIVLLIRKPVISLLLKDRAQDNALIANGYVHLDNTTCNDYEEVKHSVVKGDRGHARVNYIALAFALVAEVFVNPCCCQKQTESQEDSDNSISASGTIVARYGKTYARSTCNTSSTLLKIPSNQSIPVSLDVYGRAVLHLTKKYLAVPAYSSLIIEANVSERFTNKQFFVGTAEFRALQERTYSSVDYKCASRTDTHFENVDLDVRWLEPFQLQDSSRKDWLARKFKQSLYPSVCMPDDWLLEVFSVFIGRENDDDLNVSGTIAVEHRGDIRTIFERDGKNPDRLVNGRKLLSITRPKFVDSFFEFHIRVDLEDADDRLLIKDGAIHFVRIQFADPERAEREYDRLLCGVILGEQQRGFCAVHYANFNRAVRVEVKSVLLCKGVDVAKVYGSIVAWSGMFDYESDYDKKYYRRVLFDKSEDSIDFLRKVVSKKIEESSSNEHKLKEVELSRSYVVMPVCFPFFIDVDLYASSHFDRGPAEHLQNTFQFQVDDISPMIIEREDFDILICLKLIH